MKKYYAIAPKEGEIVSYLTNGKWYEIVSFEEIDGEANTFGKYGRGFFIINDIGTEIYCLEIECSHLNNLNWTIVEEEQGR